MAAHSAARTGDVSALEAALASDPDAVKATDKHSRTPLHLAAWAGHLHALVTLCDASADLHVAAMDGITALHFAAQQGHEDVCKELLKRGAKVNVKDHKKLNTPLHYAALKGQASLASLLPHVTPHPYLEGSSYVSRGGICSAGQVLRIPHQEECRRAHPE